MIAPLILLLLSLGGVAVAFLLPGASDLMLLAGPMALASLYLLVTAPGRRKAAARQGESAPAPVPPWRWIKRRAKPPEWVVIDGSNVMHWIDETPRIEAVRAVVAHLEGLGYTPGVMFDANAGYKLAGRYQRDRDFARELGLPRDRIMVVPKGTDADLFILTAARDLGARVVTEDRYRDWAADFPEIKTPGFLIRGEYRDGELWLDLDPAGTATARPLQPAAPA